MGVRRRIGAGDNRNCSCSSNRPYCTCAGGGDLKELLSEGVHSSAPPAGPRTYRGSSPLIAGASEKPHRRQFGKQRHPLRGTCGVTKICHNPSPCYSPCWL